MTSQPAASPAFDWAALGLAGVCLVHCLALPVAAAALPVVAGHGGSGLAHWLLLALALPISLWALLRDPVPRGAPLALGIAGLALMTLAVAGFEATPVERWLTVAGVLLVAAAHTLRWFRRRAISSAG